MAVTAGRIPKIKSISSEGTQVEDDIRASQIRDTMEVVGGKLTHTTQTLFNSLAEFISGIQASQISGSALGNYFNLTPEGLYLEGSSTSGIYSSSRVFISDVMGGYFSLLITAGEPVIFVSLGNDPEIAFDFPSTGGEFLTDNSNLAAGKVTGVLAAGNIPSLNASKINAGTFADARIPNLDAGKITTGELETARIPDLDADKITTGELGDARIPNLDASKTTSGVFADARIPDTVARVADVSQQMLNRGGLRFDGVSGATNSYGELPQIALAGQAISIMFVFQRLHPTTVPQGSAILSTEASFSIANGGFNIRHASGAACVPTFSTFTSSGNRHLEWGGINAEQPVGSWGVWGFNIDNTTPTVIEGEFFLNGQSKGVLTAAPYAAPYNDRSTGDTRIAASLAGNTTNRLQMGLHSLLIVNRLGTPTEHAEFAASGGAILPSTLPMANPSLSWSQLSFPVTTGYQAARGTVTAGLTIDGRSDVMGLEGDGGSSSHQINMFSTSGMPALDAGAEVTVEVEYFIPATNTQALAVRLFWRGGHTGIASREGSSVGNTLGVWSTMRFRALVPAIAGGDRFVIYITNPIGAAVTGTTESIYIGSITVNRTGVVTYIPCDDGNNYQCRNMVSGGQPMLLSPTGVTHDIARTPWTLSASRTSSGWLAGDRPLLSDGAEIEYASVECSASGTVSLGYNSANAAVHFTVAHPGGGARIRVPIADTSPGVTDRRLYLTAPSGATVRINLSGNIR